LSLFDTKDYAVRVTQNHIEPGFPGQSFVGYGIFNKTTDVMENSTSILPEAIRWAKNLQALLETEREDAKPDTGIQWPTRPN